MKLYDYYLVFVVILCGFSNINITPSYAVKIGVVITSDGPYEFRDNLVLEGIKVWQNWTNERGGVLLGNPKVPELIEVVTRDGYHPSNSELGRVYDASLELLQIDQVDIIVGPFSNARTKEVARAYQDANSSIPLLTNCFSTAYLGAEFDFIIGATAPPIQRYIDGIFQNFLDRGLRRFAVIYKSLSPSLTLIANTSNQFFIDNYSRTYSGARTTLVPYQATLLEDVFYSALRVVESVQSSDDECFVSLGLSQDLFQFNAIFQLLSYKPKAAYSFYDLTIEQLFEVAGGWIMGAFYITKSLHFGTSGEYMGTSEEYEQTFERLMGREPAGINTGSSASCVVWQKAAEKAGDYIL